MESFHQSAGSLSNSSSGNSSSHYADVELAGNSRFDLLAFNKNSGKSAKTSSATKIIAIISLFIGILCLICVGFLSCWIFLFDEDSPLSAHSSGLIGGGERTEMCVPCLQVSPDPLDSASRSSMWDELTVKFDEENNTRICCAVTAAQYATLFKLILQRQQEVQKLADYLEDSNGAKENTTDFPDAEKMTDSKTHVSAHLVFKPFPQRATASEDRTVQQWKSPAESPMSHVLQGLKFHSNSRIIVQTPGLYYVYCQFLYNPSHSPSSDVTEVDQVTSAYVRRYSILHPSSPSFLLKSRHTRSDVDQDRHSSYVGGVVRLYKGDALYVQVSKPDLVSHDDVASFFGLFKVGP